jgi:hypothetical protein
MQAEKRVFNGLGETYMVGLNWRDPSETRLYLQLPRIEARNSDRIICP